MATILVFGDSITYGAWDVEGGWVQRLRRFLDKKVIDSNYESYYLTYNLGISGDNSELLLERFKKEIEARIEEKDEEVIIIISTGSNDSIFIDKSKTTMINPDKFKNNLKKLFTIAKKYSKKIVFVGDAPVDETKVDPIPWLPGCSYKSSLIKQFNDMAESQCKKEKVNYIDLWKYYEKIDYKKLMVDGIHQNSEGHKIMYEIVRDYLVKNKII